MCQGLEPTNGYSLDSYQLGLCEVFTSSMNLRHVQKLLRLNITIYLLNVKPQVKLGFIVLVFIVWNALVSFPFVCLSLVWTVLLLLLDRCFVGGKLDMPQCCHALVFLPLYFQWFRHRWLHLLSWEWSIYLIHLGMILLLGSCFQSSQQLRYFVTLAIKVMKSYVFS